MHVSEAYRELSPVTALSRWVYDYAIAVDICRIGVIVFFAIGGFVIPFSMRPNAPAPERDFLLRRVFRIFPLYWFSISIGAFASHMIWGRTFTLVNMVLTVMLSTVIYRWVEVPAIAMGRRLSKRWFGHRAAAVPAAA